MTHSLTSVLEQQRRGLVFDIDGTLSPIAPTPDQAHLYPGVAESLQQARQHAHVAIMTGRAIADGARIVNVEDVTYIGTHGLEWCDGLPTTHPIQLIPEAQQYVEPGRYLLNLVEQAQLPGVIVQYKNVGGSIHYRQAANPEQTRQRILALLEEAVRQAHMHMGEGKYVIEILPPLNVNKGIALRSYVQHFGLQGVFFAGDDRTDLNAMLEAEQLRREGLATYTVLVRHPDTLPEMLEHADEIVDGVEAMAVKLQAIVAQL
ncbi:MAG TPA: trehalose-phosphatase [Ktedonobacteraceae bacterium]|jgi:trehalose 6-phosphate phosphatase